MIQLYAPFVSGPDSFAYVGRELVRFLRRHHFEGLVYATKTAFPDYTDVAWPVGLETSADVGIFVGYPSESGGWLHGHEHRILVTVCETAPVPPIWVQACNRATLVVVPSQFCKETFARGGVRTPILVCRHGVPDSWLTRNVARGRAPNAAQPRLLHVASPSSFPRRKNTSALLIAAKRVWDEGYQFELVLRGGDGKNLCDATTTAGLNRYAVCVVMKPVTDMFDFYESIDAVCQPSRGEGFGMVPLEARALGKRAILSGIPSHQEHGQPEDIVIETGPARHMMTIGNEVGYAPTVSPDAVATALRTWLRAPYARQPRLGPEWGWSRVLHPLLPYLRMWGRDTRFQGGAFLRGVG